jgi:hypothetical protein
MIVVNQKYKPVITKPVITKPFQEISRNIQGQGLNELIQKVKDMKIKEKKSNNKISFD